jgi:hypothetical protein
MIRHGCLTRSLVRPGVAGDTLHEALGAGKAPAGRGLTSTLDRLGEKVLAPTEAGNAADA